MQDKCKGEREKRRTLSLTYPLSSSSTHWPIGSRGLGLMFYSPISGLTNKHLEREIKGGGFLSPFISQGLIPKSTLQPQPSQSESHLPPCHSTNASCSQGYESQPDPPHQQQTGYNPAEPDG